MNSKEAPQQPNKGGFMKALIKIANPAWTPEQIEAEYQRKIKEVEQNPDDCEMCSG